MSSQKCRRFVSWLFIVAMVLGLVLPGQQSVLAEGTEEEVTFPVEYTFVYTNDKGKRVKETVSFQSPDDKIGLNGAASQTGEGILSDYFIGWSENKDYIENGQGHLLYNTDKVSDLINAGIKPGSELVEMRANGLTLITGYGTLNKIAINDQLSGSEFVSPGSPEKAYDEGKKAYVDKTVAEYLPGVDYKINRLDAVFSMNPFLQAAIYKNAWVGAFDNISKWEQVNKVDGRISVVDLHVSIDKRLELPDEFDIAFTSYSFYPIKIYSARDSEGNLLGFQDDYIDVGADPANLYEKVQDNNPTTTFRTKSYIEDAAGNKVRVYDYVIRTRMRNGHTEWQAKKIVPATMEQIQSDMVLSLAGGSFTVKNDVAKEIAQGGEPIKISGSITAQQPMFETDYKNTGVSAYKIPITESEVEELDFKEKTPDPQPEPQPQPQPQPKPEDPIIERIGGKDRDDTSRKIANRFFGQSKYVIVARNNEYPDALTASLLARILDCPILLNNPKYLEKETKEEIIRLGAKDIILVGQENALSKEVKTELDKLDQDKAERIGGKDRYETSALLAKRVAGLIGGVDQAIVASGEDFPDALASAPLSGKKVAPILLTRKESLPKSVAAMIKELKIKTVDIAGGNKAVATSLEKALPKLTKRYDGDNRYDTAALIANDVRTSPRQVYLASGEVFPDALTIGPVAAKTEDPILLSRKSVLPKETQDYMKKHKLSKVYIIGGTDRLDLSLEKDILDILK
ncbi:MAG: cell wall-binding repeat-containing protein [Firmicutes bacterium]|nr:cell wall-binding repeat-containing protein [Bacillota bacterium]